MTIKLDKIDYRILYELDKDCRRPFSDIARIIRKSPQYVKYRTERLKEEQVIQSVSVLIDLPSDITENYCFIKLRGSEIVEEKLLLDFIFKMPETYRLYYCDGEYDIVFSTLVRDYDRLNEIKDTLLTNFTNIDKIFFNNLIFTQIDTKNYLTDSLDVAKVIIGRNRKELDQLSKSILFELQKDPFVSLLDLSKNLNVSYDKIKYIFKNSKPYLGTRLVLSQQLVKRAILFIDATKDFERIKGYVASNPNIIQIDNLLGEYNFALYFECLAKDEISRIIKEFLYKFKDSVRSHTKLDIINIYKYRWSNL